MPLFIFFYLITFLGCDNGGGFSGASKNIEESRERGVFLFQYNGVSNPIKINDTLQVTIKEAWIELHWAYSQSEGKTLIREGYQLCINSIEKDLKDVDFTWTIGLDSEKYLRSSGKNSLIGDLTDIPKNDTLIYFVQKGSNLAETGIKDSIGKFVLVKINK